VRGRENKFLFLFVSFVVPLAFSGRRKKNKAAKQNSHFVCGRRNEKDYLYALINQIGNLNL
jgi:hypothetical protein